MRVVLLSEKRFERDAMVRALQRVCRVEAVADGKAALAAIAREAPQVVVVDVPSQGGPELIRLLRGADVSGQAYFLAVIDGNPRGGEISHVLAAGVHDFMRRPVADLELAERVRAPTRLVKWARSLATPDAFDSAVALDVARLRAWQDMGAIVANDLAQVLGHPLEVLAGWPKRFGHGVRGAMMGMSLPSDRTDVRLSLAVDAATAVWLSSALLGDAGADEASVDDVLRELVNTAAGAVKRAAFPEQVVMTTGIPSAMDRVPLEGEGVQRFTLSGDAGKVCLAVAAEIRRTERQRVPASKLREGMVLAHDLRTETGALLVAAGSRLTRTTATRIAQMLGERFLVEVAVAA